MLKIHLPLPNMAFFTAITVSSEYYDKTYKYWMTELIVVISNFHSFQVNLHIDASGTLVSHDIAKVFYRYGFYETHNYVKSFDGYFVVTQKVPTIFEEYDWYSKQVLTVYDTRERWIFNETTQTKTKAEPIYFEGTNIPVQFMLGGYTFRQGRVAYDFNFTFTRNASDPFRRIGLLALNSREARIRELRIHDHLIIETLPGISSTQTAKLKARNDFHTLELPFEITIEAGSLPGWAIALIVVGSVLVAAGAGFFIFVTFIKNKKPTNES